MSDLSERVITAHPPAPTPSLARRLVEASGLVRSLFVRVPYIRTRTSPSHSRATISRSRFLSRRRSLSRQRSLSLVSGHSLSTRGTSLSLSTCHSSRLSHLLFRLLSVAGQPAFIIFIYFVGGCETATRELVAPAYFSACLRRSLVTLAASAASARVGDRLTAAYRLASPAGSRRARGQSDR